MRYLCFILFCLCSVPIFGQDAKSYKQDTTTDGLNFYPNPAVNGRIYITSRTGMEKEVLIFDVLGKLVFQASNTSKEINISTLMPGVYIIKIKENDLSTTRKLIVR